MTNRQNSANRQSGTRVTFLTRIVAGLAIACAVPAYAEQETLLVLTESAEPFSMTKDGGKTVYGRSADKVVEIMQRSHIPYRLELTNWNRAVESARAVKNVCVFSAAKTPSREPQFIWVGALTRGDNWAIIGKSEMLGKVTKLDQIKQAQIGTYTGDASIEILAQHGIHAIASVDDATTIKNLLIGRLDYWASELEQANKMIKLNNLGDKFTVLFTFASSDFYLACNPATKPDWVAIMRDKLRKISDDGTAGTIDAHYARSELNHDR